MMSDLYGFRLSDGPSVPETGQPMFEHYFNQLKKEFVELATKDSEHRRRAEQLAAECAVFRRAYEHSEREISQLTKEKLDLENQVATLRGMENRAVCLIDGDGTIFSSTLLSQGREGGRLAAQSLTASIHSYLSTSTQSYHEYQLWVYVFYNKRGLSETLSRLGLVEKPAFEEFVIGFNQAGDRFLMVDVGNGKEAADAKIRVYLDDARSLQTWKVIFGGCHDNGYVTTLTSMITAGYRDKLILLPGYTEMAAGIEELRLPYFRTEDLFMTEKLVVNPATTYPTLPYPAINSHPSTPPPNNVKGNANVNTQQGPPPGLALPGRSNSLYSLQSGTVQSILGPGIASTSDVEQVVTGSPPVRPAQAVNQTQAKSWVSVAAMQSIPVSIPERPRVPTPELEYGGSSVSSSDSSDAHSLPPVNRQSLQSSGSSKGRRINPNVPLSKHDPPPCTLFYLASCKYGASCIYAHDYLLDDEHYTTMRANAKKSPCPAANKNEPCSFGENCLYGHKCPSAPRCHFQKQGICKFTGVGMHRE